MKKESVTPKEFAVIATGGKQYRVSVGEEITIEKLPGDYKLGERVIFDKVLMVDNDQDTTLGTPYISGASVKGILTAVGRAKKVEVVKYKAKSRYYKNRGHRQPFVKVKIEAIA